MFRLSSWNRCQRGFPPQSRSSFSLGLPPADLRKESALSVPVCPSQHRERSLFRVSARGTRCDLRALAVPLRQQWRHTGTRSLGISPWACVDLRLSQISYPPSAKDPNSMRMTHSTIGAILSSFP